MTELCHCGKPLHYSNAHVEEAMRLLIAATASSIKA